MVIFSNMKFKCPNKTISIKKFLAQSNIRLQLEPICKYEINFNSSNDFKKYFTARSKVSVIIIFTFLNIAAPQEGSCMHLTYFKSAVLMGQ